MVTQYVPAAWGPVQMESSQQTTQTLYHHMICNSCAERKEVLIFTAYQAVSLPVLSGNY